VAAALEDELEDELQRDRCNVRRDRCNVRRDRYNVRRDRYNVQPPTRLAVRLAAWRARRRTARSGTAAFRSRIATTCRGTTATYLEDELEDGLGCSPNIS
jgi:hypothetical protein